MAGPRTDKYDISCGQYLKRAYTRRTEKAPAGQRKAIGGSLFCVGKDGRIAEKSKTGKGLSYSLNQEEYLKVFLENGNVPLDNNAAERAIRNFCIGRKNWVIIDTIRGTQSSAMIYSIAETAKANHLKPYEYF